MSDAGLSKVKGPSIITRETVIPLGLVISLLGVMFYGGMQAGKAKGVEDDNDQKFKAIQIQVTREISETAEKTNLKIDSLKQSMELRAANRDKEIDAINKRLDGHELSIHELILMMTTNKKN